MFSICHSWRRPLPNGNMLAVSILDDHQREVMEESPQLLKIFSDAIKGSRYTAKRVAAPTYSFSVCFCSQLLL